MGHGRHISGSTSPITAPNPPVPPPVADYHVWAMIEPVPDCRGNYFLKGTHEGKNYYQRGDNTWYLFWDQGTEEWNIALSLNVHVDTIWTREDPNIVGHYIASHEEMGDVNVNAGPA